MSPRTRERQREDIVLAKKVNVYKGGGKVLNTEQAATLIEPAAANEAKAVLAREAGISHQTVYQYLQPELR